MDIVTHAGIGLIAAAPLLNSHPELAMGLVAGSVLPDLDAASRVFGKRAFLRAHQTWSHALPVHAGVSVLAGGLLSAGGLAGWQFGAGLFAALTFHTLLDLSNTLGVTLFAPFSKKRFCLEWVFFIDAFVLALTIAAATFTIWEFVIAETMPAQPAVFFFGILAAYFFVKGWLRRRAGSMAPEAATLMPSEVWPWQFFGILKTGNSVRRFQLNALNGSRKTLTQQDIFDDRYDNLLSSVPEFRVMRELSPAYHVVSASATEAGELICCRDLRTRNFKTTFGDLEILLDARRQIVQTTFHV
jgi:membrane-bound metal-dependent hydrolase YbcI (DUF457 family)